MDTPMTVLRDAVKAHLQRRNLELYAAWRAGYDYLYVLTHHEPDEIPKHAYIPANSPEYKFRDYKSERFDLRRESLPRGGWERLMEYRP